MLTKADKWFVGIILLIAVLGIVASTFVISAPTGQVAEIWSHGKLIKTVPLKAGYREEFRVGTDKEYDDVEADNGRIRVREANCPDQVCVHTGWISKAPQEIVCLPYKMVIKIVSPAPEVDSVAR
jgi:hypothetical protein